MTELALQMTIPYMGTSRRTTSTDWLDQVLGRTIEARKRVAATQGGFVKRFNEHYPDLGLDLAKYKKYEKRTPIRQEFLIPFCDLTRCDPYWLLTGEAFRIGRQSTAHAATEAHARPFSKAHRAS